jgi:ATPase subunit of ABC transporter with duplicated ATPase domains
MADILVKNLNKFFGSNHILKGLDFEIYNNEKVGLVGDNGSGKSTLFNILLEKMPYDMGFVNIPKHNKVGVLEQIPTYKSEFSVIDVLKSAFKEIYILKSEMDELENKMKISNDKITIKKYGETQHKYETLGGYVLNEKLARVCNGLKIDEKMKDKKFNVLSGGEKTRVTLGVVILSEPDILFLDEPTNHLDLSSIEWLEEYISDFKGTVFTISHDRYFLDKTVSKIIEIEDGYSNVYLGNYSYYVKEKEQRLIREKEEFERQEKVIKDLEESARKLHNWGREKLHKRAFSIEKRLEKIERKNKPSEKRILKSNFGQKQFSGNDVIKITDLQVKYGENLILDGVDFFVKNNDRVSVFGSNGAGKTTLIKVITGEIDNFEGKVKMGKSIRFAYLPQIVVFNDLNKTVLEVVEDELILGEERARNLLGSFNFKNEDVFKTVNDLSGGEKSRLRLCIIMQKDVNLLILDEPTNHLDISSREWIENSLEYFDGTIIFISHDRYFMNKFVNRISEIKNKKIKDFHGNYNAFVKYKEELKKKNEESIDKSVKNKTVKKNYNKMREINKMEKRLNNLEIEINDLETEIENMDNDMNNSSDHILVNEIFEKKQKSIVDLDNLYIEWDDLQEKIQKER